MAVPVHLCAGRGFRQGLLGKPGANRWQRNPRHIVPLVETEAPKARPLVLSRAEGGPRFRLRRPRARLRVSLDRTTSDCEQGRLLVVPDVISPRSPCWPVCSMTAIPRNRDIRPSNASPRHYIYRWAARGAVFFVSLLSVGNGLWDRVASFPNRQFAPSASRLIRVAPAVGVSHRRRPQAAPRRVFCITLPQF
jgi:hypothetical protein